MLDKGEIRKHKTDKQKESNKERKMIKSPIGDTPKSKLY